MNGHETAIAALLPPAADTTADAPAAGCEGSGGPAAAADSPLARGTLSHSLNIVQTMETRQPNRRETAGALPPRAAGASADTPAASGHVGAGRPAPTADSPSARGSLSHPLSTVQPMGTGQSNGHETAIAALLPPTAGASADTPTAGRLNTGRPAPAPDGGVPGVVFVGTSDVSGRVAVLVDALVGELGGLPAVGAGRDLLRSQVAALGRLRAAADAAEARVVAAVDGLGDGGVDAVEVLRRGTGSSQREAQRRKRRADALAGMPNVAGALASGDISTEHAEALARAAEATSAGAVDGDAGLLAEVAAVPADRAGRRIQEWTQRHQDPDDLHEQHLRQRRRRRLSFGDGDDGMLVANAAFDRVQGAQFRSLINGIADRIWRSEGGRDTPHNTSAAQRRLDALAIAVGLQPPPALATTARTAARTGHANPAPRNPVGPEPELAATAGTAAGTGCADPALRNPDGPEPEPPATAGTAAGTGCANPAPRNPVGPEPEPPATAGTAAGTGCADPALRNPVGPEPELAATAGTAAGTGCADPALRNPVGPEPGPPSAATAPKTERGPRNQPEPPTPNAAALAGPTEPRSGAQPEHGRGEPAARAPRHPQTDRTATDDNAASAASDNPAKGPAASGTRNTRHRRTAPSPRPPTRDQRPEPSPLDRQPVSPQLQPEPSPLDRQPVSPQLQPEPSPLDRQPVSPRLEPAAALGAPPATPNGRFESPRHQVVIVASADVVSGEDPHGRCEIPGVGPIPRSELERLACDAELFGLLFSGKGEPLWHGRAKRSVTDAQRRALIARDGGCVLCAEEPARCEAHHITPWAKPNNGPTDIDNLALLCGACHRRLHNHKRVLTRNPDGAWATTLDPRHHQADRVPGERSDPNAPSPASSRRADRASTDASAPDPRRTPGDAATKKPL